MTNLQTSKKIMTVLLIMMLAAAALVVWAAIFLPPAAQAEEEPPPKTLEELEFRIKEVLSETNTPGAAVVLTSKDEILWIGSLGFADVEKEKPVTEETMFRVGSISKSLVGLTLLRLHEKNLLDLNDPLKELAPELSTDNPWKETSPVRLIHLLEHTAGYDDMSLREYAISDPHITLEEALNVNPRTRESRWTPGKHASYSNVGPSTAAYAAEKAVGRPFEELVQEQLFEPLNMDTATFFLTTSAEERLTKSYGSDGITEIPYSHIIFRPSGAANVTPAEMGNFIQMLLNRGTFKGETLLSPESADRFERPETPLSARQNLQMGFGPGSFKTMKDGFVFVGHDGGIDGFLSSYGYLPEHGLGYFCSINSSSGQAFSEILNLIQSYLTQDLEKPALPERASLSYEELALYTGYYETFTPRMEASRFLEVILGLTRIGQENGKLYIHPLMGESKELIPVGDGKFRGSGESKATNAFIQDKDEDMVLQGYGGPVSVNLRSISPWQYWLRLGLTIAALLIMASSLLYALFWVPASFFRKSKRKSKRGYLSLHLLPLLPPLSFLGIGILLALSTTAGVNPMLQFGKLTVWSVGLFVLTVLFALTSLISFIQSIRALHWRVSILLKIHSLLVSLANMTVTFYLGYWGIIGFRIWA